MAQNGGNLGRTALKHLLTLLAAAFLTVMIVIPAGNVLAQALGLDKMEASWLSWRGLKALPGEIKKGMTSYAQTLAPPEVPPEQARKLPLRERRALARQQAQAEKTWSAIRMTLGVAAVVVPLNIVFGVAAAWAITKFRFKGRSLLVSLIDLPFSVSPVVAGLIFVLLMGRQGYFGEWAGGLTWPEPLSIHWKGFADGWWPLGASRWQTGVIFTPLATVLATLFVTFPFVARALIPLMDAQGTDEEQAARVLGAGGWTTFRRVTLPNIKWGLIYGAVLCTARAMGEFGAVSVVSGHLDANDTMPLRVEKLWNEYNTQAAFTVASLLGGLAVVTLAIKALAELRLGGQARPGTTGGRRQA